MSKNSFWSLLAVVILCAGGYFAVTRHFFSTGTPATVIATSTAATSTADTVISREDYSCDDGKTIAASYTQAGVSLSFSDGRSLTLPQTTSGSGIRYEGTSADATGSSIDIVFWSEGDNAFVTENGSSTFQECLAGTVSPGPGGNTFTDQANTFSFDFPSNLTVTGAGGGYTQSWMINATTSGMILAEIKVPQSYATGTNFVDAKLTVGTSADPSAVATCLTYNPGGAKSAHATTTPIGGLDYATFHSSDAGAGNYYDTTSYRVSRNSQCYALEYTIHYANFKNFPKGSVTQFDEASMAASLDAIVRSFAFK